MSSLTSLDSLPGYRRRFRITAGDEWVRSELEDDFHCMAVTLRHVDEIVTAVEPEMVRAPWTTCPGAVQQLTATFAGLPLSAFARRGDKSANCTHLHDLAVLAAAHAGVQEPLVYDILVSDPVSGRRIAELRKNATAELRLVEEDGKLIEPAELAGRTLWDMREWIDAQGPSLQQAARMLRWGAIVALGRVIPMAEQSDASSSIPGSCFTFQPAQAAIARRIGKIRDFSAGAAQPLAGSFKTTLASGDSTR